MILTSRGTRIRIRLLCNILRRASVVAEDIQVGGAKAKRVAVRGTTTTYLSFMRKSFSILQFCKGRTVRHGLRHAPLKRKAVTFNDHEKASDRRCGPTMVLTRGKAARATNDYCNVLFMCDNGFSYRTRGSRFGRAHLLLKLGRRLFSCPLATKRAFAIPRIVLSCSTSKLSTLSRRCRGYVHGRIYHDGCIRVRHPILVGD